ncbi:hypothetical protein M378DRAFT_160771 [Amanita muscaria Koide BX008]|uniref:Uncharacterized protein n=1 Tax=Amanita muscaria (strain Koide BX008) TaxID=946122 RepID=A0A0C2XAL0_AMAMK|nr:hypothetical protein M378DRAFT_160771 [Amanita muscaria Koide BX008]
MGGPSSSPSSSPPPPPPPLPPPPPPVPAPGTGIPSAGVYFDPYAVCREKGHEPKKSFGILGIIAAIVFFPIGLLCCFLDRWTVCRRCGATLAKGWH